MYINKPIIIQYIKYIEDVFSVFREKTISIPQIIIPMIGRAGHNGTLNGLCLLGSVLRKIKTATQIITNETNVPYIQRSADIFKFINKPQTITTNPEIHVIT